MGKSYKKQIGQGSESNYNFDVLVRVHGKNPHTETYSIDSSHYVQAKQLGYFKEKNQYLDWKPLGGKDFQGGLFKVNSYSKDDKYLYAHTDNKVFSLPKYLEKGLINDKYILVGNRKK